MCGIAGSLHFDKKRDLSLHPLLEIMKHRGPDESSVIEQDRWSIGANRLAISAPQERDTQPLWSSDKRFCFVFNGEIYNHEEIRNQLVEQGCHFRTSCDTEVLFYAYLEYGSEAFLRCQGMFACAIFDALEKQWTLARDPFGIKPLYFQTDSNCFVFASEIKPLLFLKKSHINQKVLPYYLQRRFVLGKETLFSDIFRVMPGEIMKVFTNGEIKTRKYYLPTKTQSVYKNKKERFKEFSDKLEESIHLSSKSEVGLGVLLSGGLDSSLINSLVCFFQKNSVQETEKSLLEAWFFDNTYDQQERVFTENLTKKLNQKLHWVYSESNDFLLLPKIIRALEEPLGDSIIIPSYKLMECISQNEKAVLAGEGADEILGGYAHHWIFYLFKKLGFLRAFAGFLAEIFPPAFLNFLFPYPGRIGKNTLQKSLLILKRDGLKRFIEMSHLFSLEEINQLVPGLLGDSESLFQYPDIASLKELLFFDIQNWLPNYNLLRVDKLSMTHSLEIRVPYLSLDFASFCLDLPEQDIISLFQRKKILRKFAYRNSFLNWRTSYRKKHPFTLKEMDFYGKPYKEFIHDHLDKSFRETWNINTQALNRLLNKKTDLLSQKQITSLLNLSIWTKEFF